MWAFWRYFLRPPTLLFCAASFLTNPVSPSFQNPAVDSLRIALQASNNSYRISIKLLLRGSHSLLVQKFLGGYSSPSEKAAKKVFHIFHIPAGFQIPLFGKQSCACSFRQSLGQYLEYIARAFDVRDLGVFVDWLSSSRCL